MVGQTQYSKSVNTYFHESADSSLLSPCRSPTFTRTKVWVCVITNKTMFWALHDCTILYNRFLLPYIFLHSNETRDWLAYFRQSSPFSVSMFWLFTRAWQINLSGRYASSSLRNGWTRMQSLHQENRQTLRKVPCGKQGGNQLFIRNTDSVVWLTEKQRIYWHKEVRIYCIKSCNHARPRTWICSLFRRPTSFDVKVGLRRRLITAKNDSFQQETFCFRQR